MDYKNQYIGLTQEQKLRTTVEIDLKDISVLRGFDPKAGTLQTTVSILFKKLIHELKQSKLEPGDFSNYQHAVCSCTITLGGDTVQRGTVIEPATGTVDSRPVKAAGGNVGRGVKKLARNVKGTQKLHDYASASCISRDVCDETIKTK
jgi:hypothetical protein